ncbi:TonB-dependent receptor plug domain-containing protein [Actomonas aquatica]|uniref:TonB-dependent receptor plug domain-containing protein n=1 Tax=Actomonas aquatica TaxID=2866162 RepID=A0ABZ1C509_9BACT|nr:TonB-dependent receptor plug domain-containing protein [Opitutus sp. WL0086]WRQ86819.1 TonB-dependent receptor plug domain-containing protein [Opitutus sp. WL0086]
MHTKKDKTLPRFTLAAVSACLAAGSAWAQSTTASSEIDDEDVIVLSPFEVSAEEDNQGYTAATTLAGNRLNTELRDIGNAVTVITSQFLDDIAATDNESLLQYTTGTEVGNLQGNFAGVGDGTQLNEEGNFTNPNQNTRVRGLTSADTTRDFFLTDIPWDGYSVDRVDLQRGPNSILFGQGSPAGIINAGLKQASFKNSNEVTFRVASYGSARAEVDFNRVLIEDQLAVRIAAVKDDQKFQQDPAFQDSERVFAALRFEPEFLKRGSARTIIKANFEDGSINSNRPRTLPPLDYITPWFYTGTYQGTWTSDVNYTYQDGETISVSAGDPRTFNYLNKGTWNPFQIQDDNTGRPNHGLTRPAINGGPDSGQPNRWYTPWMGSFGFDAGHFHFDGNGSVDPLSAWQAEIRGSSGGGGLAPDGTTDDDLSTGFHRMGGVQSYSTFAVNSGLPYSEFGVYKDRSLIDSTVFDFYNNLIDGPTKKEWQDFDVFNISLAQTFMNDKFGFEVVFNQEDYSNGRLALLTGGNQGIWIDFNNVYADGTVNGVPNHPSQTINGVSYNLPNADGTPNPNLGRAFVNGTSGSNNSFSSEREGLRGTAFFTHDFARDGDSSFLKRLLGKHTLTGLVAEESRDTDNRSWQRYVIDKAWTDWLGRDGDFNGSERQPQTMVYLGPSLLNASSASGAYIPRITTNIDMPQNYAIYAFDSTWNPPAGVNPGDDWYNAYNLPIPDASNQLDQQADNRANYVGWRYEPVTIYDSEDNNGALRDAHTTFARLTRSEVESQAFVWQAHLLDNAIVGTWGWREDTARNWEYSTDTNDVDDDERLNLSPGTYKLRDDFDNELTVESTSYSIVAHLDDLPGLKNLTERLPFLTTIYYNESENFQPAAERVDVYGEPIPAPSGVTEDLGILLESKDGRFSLKVNKYETQVLQASSSGLGGAWFIGSSQVWSGNWVNRYEYDLGSAGYRGIDRVANPDPENSLYNYGGGQDGEDYIAAHDRELRHIALWREWQASVDPRFYEAWGIDLAGWEANGLSSSTPAGFTVPEDAVSKGYEIEFSAQPTRNWRLTLNASKTTAVRQNIGGENLAEFVSAYENFLNNTDGGDLRIWWGGAGNERALFQWNTNVGAEWAARKLQEGTDVPELREWRVNAITNYDFDEGILKGVNVGAAIRWQDDVVIGFPPIPNPAQPGRVNFDLDNPYRGPAETNIDLWVGYSRRLSDKIDWRIQLNVRNVGQGNELIPITVQPDGTPATYRIAPHQTWSLTNSFKF